MLPYAAISQTLHNITKYNKNTVIRNVSYTNKKYINKTAKHAPEFEKVILAAYHVISDSSQRFFSSSDFEQFEPFSTMRLKAMPSPQSKRPRDYRAVIHRSINYGRIMEIRVSTSQPGFKTAKEKMFELRF